jgi:hypothetical protein
VISSFRSFAHLRTPKSEAAGSCIKMSASLPVDAENLLLALPLLFVAIYCAPIPSFGLSSFGFFIGHPLFCSTSLEFISNVQSVPEAVAYSSNILLMPILLVALHHCCSPTGRRRTASDVAPSAISWRQRSKTVSMRTSQKF